MAEEEDVKPEFICVSCGPFQGRLWLDKFICPGIHQKCIEVDGDLMTPKSFCIIGDKQKLKDWKNAIRINGRSVRKLMDTGEFDFYKHDEICTGRCMSRHCGPSKYDTKIEKIQQKNYETAKWGNFHPATLCSKEFDRPPYKVELEGPEYNLLRKFREASPDMDHSASGSVVFPGMDLDDSSSQKMDFVIKQEVCSDDDEHLNGSLEAADFRGGLSSYPRPGHVMETAATGGAKNTSSRNRRKNPVPQQIPSNGKCCVLVCQPENGFDHSNDFDHVGDSSKIASMVAELPDTEKLLEDSVTFWQGIVDMGLLEQVIRDAQLALEYLKRKMVQNGVTEPESQKLSDIVSKLGLSKQIKWRMADHKAKTERESQKLLQELQELRKKVAESEVKREVLKRKSDCLDNLLERAQPKRAASVSNDLASKTSQNLGSDSSIRSADVNSECSTTSSNHTASHEPTSPSQVPSIATVARSPVLDPGGDSKSNKNADDSAQSDPT